MRGRRKWRDRALDLVTAAVAVVAIYVVVTERIAPRLRGRQAPLVTGERLVQELEFRGLAGSDAELEEEAIVVPDGRAALLLVFVSTCPACSRNLPAWRRAMARAGVEVRRLAIAIEPDRGAARQYARLNLPRAKAVEPLDTEGFVAALGVDVVPFTALIAGDGTVAYLRRGRLDSMAVETLRRALGALSGPSTR